MSNANTRVTETFEFLEDGWCFNVTFEYDSTACHFVVQENQRYKGEEEQFERCMSGRVKYDSSMYFDVGNEQPGQAQFLYMNGPYGIQRHFALLKFIYERAGALMGSTSFETWTEAV